MLLDLPFVEGWKFVNMGFTVDNEVRSWSGVSSRFLLIFRQLSCELFWKGVGSRKRRETGSSLCHGWEWRGVHRDSPGTHLKSSLKLIIYRLPLSGHPFVCALLVLAGSLCLAAINTRPSATFCSPTEYLSYFSSFLFFSSSSSSSFFLFSFFLYFLFLFVVHLLKIPIKIL